MRRSLIGFVAAGLVAVVASSSAWSQAGDTAEDELKNPYLGQKEAIEEGRRIYRGKCMLCHRQMGGRGPNLFATKLTDERFLDVVINGRLGMRGQMPAFGYRMSFDDIWKVHAFIKSRDRF